MILIMTSRGTPPRDKLVTRVVLEFAAILNRRRKVLGASTISATFRLEGSHVCDTVAIAGGWVYVFYGN